jgi:hypothetical protein
MSRGRRPKPDVSTKPWRTVEALCPPMMSVVSSGFEGKEFMPVEAELQRMLGNLHPGGELTSADLAGKVKKIIDGAEPDGIEIGRNFVMLVLPILGPTGRGHGGQLWLGPRDMTPPSPRPACGLIFEFDTLMVHKPLEFTRMLGCPTDMYHERRPLAEMLDGTIASDSEEDLVRLLHLDRSPGEGLRFQTTVANYRGRTMKWQVTIRTPLTPSNGAMVLVEDLTGTTPMRLPSLADIGLKAHNEARSSHVGILIVTADSDPVVPRWLTAPPPWVYYVDPFAVNDRAGGPDRVRGFIHPDDRAAVVKARNDGTVVVRCLDHHGGYTPTRIGFTPYPGYDGSRMRIAQFETV